MTSKEAENYTNELCIKCPDKAYCHKKCQEYKYSCEVFDAGVESVITKLKDEFINKPKEDILERALDDYFSGSTHFCSNDEDIERLFSHVIDYFIRKS